MLQLLLHMSQLKGIMYDGLHYLHVARHLQIKAHANKPSSVYAVQAPYMRPNV